MTIRTYGGYLPLTGGTLTGTLTGADGSAWSSTGLSIASGKSITVGGAQIDSGYNYQTPLTGFAITIGNTTTHTIIDPAGTLAAGTITMPAAPTDGQTLDIRFSQIVTALTIAPNTGQSIKGAPTGAAVGSTYTAIYRAANTTWYF